MKLLFAKRKLSQAHPFGVPCRLLGAAPWDSNLTFATRGVLCQSPEPTATGLSIITLVVHTVLLWTELGTVADCSGPYLAWNEAKDSTFLVCTGFAKSAFGSETLRLPPIAVHLITAPSPSGCPRLS